MIVGMFEDTNIFDPADIVLPDIACGAGGSGLRVRLAAVGEEIDAIRALRRGVLHQRTDTRQSPRTRLPARDVDVLDEIADHLILVDKAHDGGADGVVGTCRLLRGSVVRAAGSRLAAPGFATGTGYDIAPLLQSPGEILELGGACIEPAHRTQRSFDLLRRGIAAYGFAFNIDIMFGCASFAGTDPTLFADSLALLHHRYLAPAHIRPRALPDRHVAMDGKIADEIDEPAAWRALPPDLRGYLRLGATVGDGAVINRAFDATDICLVLRTDRLTDRCLRRRRRRPVATRALRPSTVAAA